IIISTSYNAADMIRRVSEYNVNYFILKPFELSDLEKRILGCVDKNKENNKVINLLHSNLQISVTKLLHELGVPSHIKGYQYIREGIIMLYENPGMIGGITKELYPEIASKFDTTVSRVERAIRHAIEVSWNRGDWKLMEEIFGHSVDIDKAKPTNSEFIVTISDKLRLEFRKVSV
ncbi:MAG: sporulation initiation factor Spo0A C-terminal domain-containing protein, partial [Bacilli bacterium]|nr:sporulation initiation factor Spo0A C-terminal domain-containing protein [Bacilli bacterium]